LSQAAPKSSGAPVVFSGGAAAAVVPPTVAVFLGGSVANLPVQGEDPKILALSKALEALDVGAAASCLKFAKALEEQGVLSLDRLKKLSVDQARKVLDKVKMSEIQIDAIMEAIAPTPVVAPVSLVQPVVPLECSFEGIWTKNDGGDYWISLKVVGASSGYSAFLSLISKGAEPGRVLPPCPLFIGFGTPIHVSSNSFSLCWNDPGFMGRVNHWGGGHFRKVENSNAITDGAHLSPGGDFRKDEFGNYRVLMPEAHDACERAMLASARASRRIRFGTPAFHWGGDGWYKGDLDASERPDGFGVFEDKGGCVYQGQWSHGVWHGFGKLFWANKVLWYEGAFVENKFHGRGRLYNGDGSLFAHREFVKENC
jgi:hypothetical protein